MTTFDQRYEAWIQGRMPVDEAEAFERELDERVPSDEEMAACLQDTVRLTELFAGTEAAPPLPNADFLNHSIMRQILEEQSAESALTTAAAGEKPSLASRLVSVLKLLRAPRFALPIGALAMTAILGVTMLQPGDTPGTSRKPFHARFDNISMPNPNLIWAGQVGNANVLWVEGLDWIPGDTAALN